MYGMSCMFMVLEMGMMWRLLPEPSEMHGMSCIYIVCQTGGQGAVGPKITRNDWNAYAFSQSESSDMQCSTFSLFWTRGFCAGGWLQHHKQCITFQTALQGFGNGREGAAGSRNMRNAGHVTYTFPWFWKWAGKGRMVPE